MLVVAGRLLEEFAHLPFLVIAETMNAVRRHAASGPDSLAPDTVYRLTRAALLHTGQD